MTTETTDRATAQTIRWPLYAWWLAFVGLVAIHPRSGVGLSSTLAWHDQQEFLQALTDTIAMGRSDMIDGGIVGPGYVALGRLVHEVTRLPPDASLVVLAVLSFVATGLLLVTIVHCAAAALLVGTRAALML